MRVLVCGSREWTDDKIVTVTLNGFLLTYETLTIIEGGARGADRCAAAWVNMTLTSHPSLGHERYPADWDQFGKRAGPVRNQQMLDEGRPGVVLAFKDHFDWSLKHGGTEDMIRRAKDHQIPYYIIGTH